MTSKKLATISAGNTNTTDGSLVKVIVPVANRWISPPAASVFYIDEAVGFPDIVFEILTDHPGPFRWSWTISWEAKTRVREKTERAASTQKTFSQSGSFTSREQIWKAAFDGSCLGGTLLVQVVAGKNTFRRSVIVKAKNPSEENVNSYLAELEDVSGFELIIAKESGYRNFIDADGEPLLSFDGGYGLTQITNPAPTYEQVWNWKENIMAGCQLYQEKQRIAKSYLGRNQREYTAEQLTQETLSRWNGGAYHVWNVAEQQWKRKENILCDSETGNIGWDKNLIENSGKNEADLHERDKTTYAKPKQDKTAANKWVYTGVCYADQLADH